MNGVVMQFETEKHGYNKSQVDRYIANLNISSSQVQEEQKARIKNLVSENESLKIKLGAYKNKEDLISKALIDAMARAKKIEENSSKIYELEIQKLRLLYNKYKTLLDNLIESNACLEVVDSVTKYAKNFKQGINKVLSSQNERVHITQNADAKMRELLTRMNNVVTDRENSFVVSAGAQVQAESVSEAQHQSNIKPICNINLEKSDNFENLVDKFLDLDEGGSEENAFANELLNKEKKTNGFDLKQAINPTESLEDIMKDFDLDED